MTDSRRLTSPKYLIDDILPSREVHLLGGPSGSGKSTWWFQVIPEWAEGKPVLGHTSHPTPWCYVSTDRSTEGVIRTLERLGIDPSTIPFISVVDEVNDSPTNYLDLALRAFPEAKLILLEGISSLVPVNSRQGDGGYRAVTRFLRILGRLCREHDVTVWGSAHSPKMKPEDRFTNPRQRVMGSVAWGGYSESIFLIEPLGDEDRSTANRRVLTVEPRNAPPEFHDLAFNSKGRLIPFDPEADLDAIFIEEFLKKHEESGFTTAEFHSAMAKFMSERTSKRRLQELEKAHRVVLVSRGRYRVALVV